MNQTFDFTRFSKLVAKHWMENYKRYSLTLLAVAGLLTVWFGIILLMDYFDPMNIFMQYSAYFIGLYFTGCLYASTLFADLSSRTTGIFWLSLPASHFEKLLCSLLFSVFLFFIAYTLVFYIVDIPMVHFANRQIEGHPRTYPNSLLQVPDQEVYNIFTAKGGMVPERVFHFFLLGFFAIQAAFTLGSVWFTRYAFVKTTVAVLLMVLLVTVALTQLREHLVPHDWHSDLTSWYLLNSRGGIEKQVRLPAWLYPLLRLLTQYSGPLVLWTITYYRLKEKEV